MPLDEVIVKTERLLKDPLIAVVGESDFNYSRTVAQGREAQKRLFAAHPELGAEADLLVQIHDRDAHADTLEVLADIARAGQLIMLHCFFSDVHLARALAEGGWYASLVGPLTYPANENFRAVLIIIPRKFVLAETDVPHLTFVPHRGSSNTSYMVAHTVQSIAELWNVGEEEACVQLMENTRHVYGTW